MSDRNVIQELKDCQKKSGFLPSNILHEKDWTSRNYWKYRILRPIIKLRFKWFRYRHRPAPWIAPAATLFLDEWLNKDRKMAEFGSGFSTIFFAERVNEIVSIEHFKPWYDKVVEIFKNKSITNIDYRFIPENVSDESIDTSLSESISEYDPDFKIKNEYTSYFQALSDKPEEYFDIILVDGRARTECVFSSLDKLKKGGLMVLDNSERSRYKVVFNRLKSWESHTVSNGLTDTSFWIKSS